MPRSIRAGLACLLLLVGGGGMIACRSEALEAFPDRYVGVGVELTIEAAGARVVRVLPGGPAAEGGLVPGDVLLEVDGQPVRGKTLADVVSELRGEPGSTLRVRARTSDGNRDVTLTRRAIAKQGSYQGRL